MHNGSSVYGRLGDKLAVLGNTGILFTMDGLPKAYWINSTSKGTSAISLENLHLPELSTDCTLMQFYTEAVTGKTEREADKKIAEAAIYSKKSDGTLVVQINGMIPLFIQDQFSFRHEDSIFFRRRLECCG